MTDSSPKSDSTRKYEIAGQIVSIFTRGERWYANWQLEGKQHRRSLRTKSKKEARRKAAVLEAEILRGDHSGSGKHVDISVADGFTAYLKYCETEQRADKTIAKYTSIFKRATELASELRRTSLAGIDICFIDEYRHRRVTAGRAPKTIYNETMIIRQVVNHALSRGFITQDPLAKLKLKKPKPTPQPCWSREESQRILRNSAEPDRTVLTVLADTGARVGELKWLTWKDVDFELNVLHIRPKKGWKPKTGDIRAVPMTTRVHELLKAQKRRSSWVFTAPPSAQNPGNDRQISDRRLLQHLKRVIEPLGLVGHLHTFRHTFISHAIMSDIPSEVVRDMVGHVDDKILKLYTHIADKRKQSAIARFENATEGPPDSGQSESVRGGNSELDHEE